MDSPDLPVPAVRGCESTAIIDLRAENRELLERVYVELLQVHFPVADELDDLDDIVSGLDSNDGTKPEMHLLVAKTENALQACLLYEYYPSGAFCLVSYICAAKQYRGQGLAKMMLQKLDLQMLERTNGRGPETIFAETHQMTVEDGIMDARARQKVLASLGFQCLKFEYTQPPLSEHHQPCRGLHLLVKGRTELPSERVMTFLDSFAKSVHSEAAYGCWHNEPYFRDMMVQLEKPMLATLGPPPW